MTPADVLRLQMDLVIRLDGNSPLTHYLNGIISESMATGSEVSAHVQNHVRQATAYTVERRMTAVATARAESPDIAPLLPGVFQVGRDIMPPRPSGFVVLDEPFRYADVNNQRQFVHMMTWGPSVAQHDGQVVSGWLVTMWNDVLVEPDETVVSGNLADEMNRQFYGRWSPVHITWMGQGMRLGPTRLPPSDEQREKAKIHDRPINEDNVNIVRLIAALWQLFEETISDHSPAKQIDRSIRRGAERLRLDPQVTVITLRHQVNEIEHPGSGTPLEFRVPVEQHTRTYWTGPGRTVPVKHTIGSHWRGPKGAPIRIRPKLNRLSR